MNPAMTPGCVGQTLAQLLAYHAPAGPGHHSRFAKGDLETSECSHRPGWKGQKRDGLRIQAPRTPLSQAPSSPFARPEAMSATARTVSMANWIASAPKPMGSIE